MLLADTRGVTGPDCPFKQNRILSFNGVNVAEKVNLVEQGDRNALAWPADPKMGYKNAIKWSAQTAEFNVRDRLFSQLIKDVMKCEEIEAERIQKVQDWQGKRKRGTTQDANGAGQTSDQSFVPAGNQNAFMNQNESGQAAKKTAGQKDAQNNNKFS